MVDMDDDRLKTVIDEIDAMDEPEIMTNFFPGAQGDDD
jgi:hypothetical protein